ncbi:MAG: AAA family ATPase [Nanoarchaeota archaeon]|nr:AAA family ATPase [Nanoarchaeota archaeon]
MEIKLKSLRLENFKGIRKFTLEPGGKCLIRGANGSGKTTLMDAFLWLLFNKDSEGKADFAIKTLKNGQEIPNLEHSVEEVFDIDGQVLTLKKVLKEKYTKKRGSSQSDFTGHTTDYYIDGVPITQREYQDRVQSIINEETFKLLTSPMYFNSLHWEKRRALLLEVCGDISDSDVIASDKALASLPELLGNRLIENQKKVITSKRKEINDRLKEIPSRIDELDKSLTDVSEYDVESIHAEIKRLDDAIQAMKDDRQSSLLRKQKAELQAKLSELEMEKSRAYREATKVIDDKIGTLEKELRVKQAYTEDSLNVLAKKESTIKRNEEQMARLRMEYAEVVSKNADVVDTCPTCKQSLPKDQVQEAIKKHNENQAYVLNDINFNGKTLKIENERLAAEIEEITKKGIDNDVAIQDLKAQIELKSIPINVPFDTGKIDKTKAEIQAIEKQITENVPPDTSPLEELRSILRIRLATIDASKRTRIRIEELSAEEKKLAADYEELERQISLMDKFTVAKVDLLESKINSKFPLARFKLFNVLINGGIDETCETLYHGTPYNGGLSTGEQIVIGCDIISTLQEYYNVKAVLWLDHKESLTSELDMDCQTISLIADKKFNELVIEN